MTARPPIDPDELRRLVEVDGLSFAAAARGLGVPKHRVERLARRHGIESQHVRPRRDQLRDAEWLRAQFDAGRSITEVADELGVHYGSVVTARGRFGIGEPRRPRRTVDVDEVTRRLEAGESQAAIGRALGHGSSAISKAARRMKRPGQSRETG